MTVVETVRGRYCSEQEEEEEATDVREAHISSEQFSGRSIL